MVKIKMFECHNLRCGYILSRFFVDEKISGKAALDSSSDFPIFS